MYKTLSARPTNGNGYYSSTLCCTAENNYTVQIVVSTLCGFLIPANTYDLVQM